MTSSTLANGAILNNHSILRYASEGTSPPPNQNNQGRKKPDDIEYEVKFTKTKEVGEIVKKFYSVYGPLFIICHISVSLISVSFWYSVVYFTVDPVQYIPEALMHRMNESMAKITGEGGKFLVAYAVHKVLLPIRLMVSIYLTRRYAAVVQPYSAMISDKISTIIRNLKSTSKSTGKK